MYDVLSRGLRAGALAGLLLVGIFFVDFGPYGFASNLVMVAHWFALDGNSWGRVIGALLLVVLGSLFGGLFGVIVRRSSSLRYLIVVGLAVGLCWWVVLVLLLSTVLRHIQQSSYGTLYWLVVSLLYGLVLASLYGQFQKGKVTHEPRMV